MIRKLTILILFALNRFICSGKDFFVIVTDYDVTENFYKPIIEDIKAQNRFTIILSPVRAPSFRNLITTNYTNLRKTVIPNISSNDNISYIFEIDRPEYGSFDIPLILYQIDKNGRPVLITLYNKAVRNNDIGAIRTEFITTVMNSQKMSNNIIQLAPIDSYPENIKSSVFHTNFEVAEYLNSLSNNFKIEPTKDSFIHLKGTKHDFIIYGYYDFSLNNRDVHIKFDLYVNNYLNKPSLYDKTISKTIASQLDYISDISNSLTNYFLKR
jgi:hypothetical protein